MSYSLTAPSLVVIMAFVAGCDLAPAPDVLDNPAPMESVLGNSTSQVAGAAIAFASNRGGENFAVYTMRPRGAQVRQVSQTPTTLYNGRPSWAPDGSRMTFTSCRPTTGCDVFVMDTDGSNEIRLTEAPGSDHMSVWSPAGDKIAFVSNREGNFEIYVMDIDGENETRLTDHGSADEFPSWSPDGSRIVFQSSRNGNNQLYIMNAADGSNVVQLTSTGSNGNPAWSPDGGRVAFVSERNAEPAEIYVIDTDGSDEKRLTKNAADEYYPAWSPNGKQLAFVSDRDGDYEIYIMQVDGSKQIRITHDPAWDADPSWAIARP